MIDRDRADGARRRLLKYKAIMTGADRYRVIRSDINRVVAVADGYRVISKKPRPVVEVSFTTSPLPLPSLMVSDKSRYNCHDVAAAVAECDFVNAATGVYHVAVAVAECDRGGKCVGVHHVARCPCQG